MTEMDKEKARLILHQKAEYGTKRNMMFYLEDLLNDDCSNLRVSDLPSDIEIVAHDDFCNQWTISVRENKGYLERLKAIPYFNWEHEYSVRTYGLKMIEIMKSSPMWDVIPDENAEHDRDGENFFIWYDVKIDENSTIKEIFSYEKNLEMAFESQTEAVLGKGELSQDTLNNEMSFSQGILLPLLRRMGYDTPQYNHSSREFGKDIIFSETDKLGIRRTFAIQVKIGNVSGEASGQLDKIVAQIDDAFCMAYNDIYSKERRCITDVLVVITGRFTGNAKNKICEKIKNPNVHFIDIDKIQALTAKYFSNK